MYLFISEDNADAILYFCYCNKSHENTKIINEQHSLRKPYPFSLQQPVQYQNVNVATLINVYLFSKKEETQLFRLHRVQHLEAERIDKKIRIKRNYKLITWKNERIHISIKQTSITSDYSQWGNKKVNDKLF